jgi:hypothetical protein
MKKTIPFLLAGVLMLTLAVHSQKGKSVRPSNSDTTKPKVYTIVIKVSPYERGRITDTLSVLIENFGKKMYKEDADFWIGAGARQLATIFYYRASVDSTK